MADAETRRQRVAEDTLARDAAAGDRAAMERLLAGLYDHVHAVCRRICVISSDADDAAQEALLAIVRGIGSFDGRSSVRTWAHRVAANAALDEVRRRSRRPEPTDSDRHPAVRPDGAPTMDESVGDRLDIDTALEGLAPEFRAAVVLRDVMGMDYADIATTLGVPVGTVRSRIARGRRQLVESLGLGNRSSTTSVSSEEP